MAIAPEPHYELCVPFKLRRRGVEAKLVIGVLELGTGEIDQRLQALVAAAHQRLGQLATGEVKSIVELACAAKIDPSDVGRSLQIALLAPDILEAIVMGDDGWFLRRP